MDGRLLSKGFFSFQTNEKPATAAQITKSYHRLSRKHHPDKASNHNSKSLMFERQQKDKLHRIQQAYEILKDDQTRLLYHKYGISDQYLAVILLLGPSRPDHYSKLDSNPLHIRLVQLMGRDISSIDDNSRIDYHQEDFLNPSQEKMQDSSSPSLSQQRGQQQQREHRVRVVAARLVELLRPIVEGRIHPHIIAHHLAEECDQLKVLPLGAQIIRCVGRSYRHAGQDYLRTHPSKLPTPLRRKWHTMKGYWTAILASGRATISEQVWGLTPQQLEKHRRKEQKKQPKKSIEYPDPFDNYADLDLLKDDSDGNDNGYIYDDMLSIESHEEVQHLEQLKARNTMLQALQVEALWQITKIEIDKTIRQACDMILEGDYFFFPSHQEGGIMNGDDYPHYYHSPDNGIGQDDGWVGSSGSKVIYTDEARIEAAKALTLLGNVMVQRSKEGTAWKD